MTIDNVKLVIYDLNNNTEEKSDITHRDNMFNIFNQMIEITNIVETITNPRRQTHTCPSWVNENKSPNPSHLHCVFNKIQIASQTTVTYI